MAVDYVALAATATKLIKANGRTLSFVRLEETPSDTAKPWRGAVAPRNTADSTVSGSGVSVEPSAASRLGIAIESDDFIQRADQIFIAVADEDIENYDEVIDESIRWKIIAVKKLRPATTTVLFYVSVKR